MCGRAALSLALWLALLPAGLRAEWVRDARDMMGTRVEIQVWTDDPGAGRKLLEAGMAEFARIDAAMSTYRETSEISRVNREAAIAPVVVSTELHQLVARSLALSQRSGGAFDITFDSVGRLYDFRARQRPDTAALAENLAAIDWRHVQLFDLPPRITFSRPGTRINLGGIAKGYACERVIDLLRAAGVRHALANAGGDTRLLGDRRGKPWVVGIRDPNVDDRWLTRLALDNEAISTSGDYERFFDEDGVRYHHILNPGTGTPASGLRSVTIIGPDATMTDGLSTTVFVLGRERGLSLIEETPGYAAVLVDDRHNVVFSSQLRAQ